MGGLRRLGPGLAEIKRIYVRPNLRGHRLGEQLLRRLLDDARTFGYDHVYLDTGPFMKSAHRIYENAGFVDRGPYEGVEVPVEFHHLWRFMELSLQPHEA
jgi:GNAT superfamily N-acetyltransferase